MTHPSIRKAFRCHMLLCTIIVFDIANSCVSSVGGEENKRRFKFLGSFFFVVVIVLVVVFYEQQSKDLGNLQNSALSQFLIILPGDFFFIYILLFPPFSSFASLSRLQRCKVLTFFMRSTFFGSCSFSFLTTSRKETMLFLQTLISRGWPIIIKLLWLIKSPEQ